MRVLAQIRHDPRTIALLLVVPSALLFLLQQLLGDASFDRLGAPMVGMFPFITMFLVTSISMLRERTTGTLERLMTMPLAKLDLLGGYGIAFALLATVQALVTSAVAFLLLGLDAAGSTWLIIALAVLNAVLGSALGLLASAFASSEFQAVQFMPAFVLPADPALRPARAARPDGRLARGDRLRAAAHLRLRGARRGRRRRRRARRRGRRRRRAAGHDGGGGRACRAHLAAANRLETLSTIVFALGMNASSSVGL